MPSGTVTLILPETESYYAIGDQAFIQFANVYAYFYIFFSFLVYIQLRIPFLIQNPS